MSGFVPSAHVFTLLFVEDDHLISELILSILSRRFPSARLRVAKNGRHGLELFREQPYDLILTDICMPELDGIGMAREIRKYDASVPIIFLTAYRDSRVLSHALDLGASRYVLKPVIYQELLGCIAECLAGVPKVPRGRS